MTISLFQKPININDQFCIADLLNYGKFYLNDNHIKEAETEALLLLSYLLNLSKSELFLNRSKPVSLSEIRQYQKWLNKRLNGIPVQYITGFQNFMGLEFSVSAGVLIPRPETEILVEKVLQLIEEKPGKEKIRLLDIGTGSGVIPVSICNYFQKKGKDIVFYAVDKSLKAIKSASKNASHFSCQKNIHFYQGDLFSPFRNDIFLNSFDGIVSNPPYLSKSEWDNLADEIRLFEPSLAFLAGEKGLDFYKNILQESPSFLKPGGFLALEIGYKQKRDVCTMINKNNNFQKNVISYCDYLQNDRVIIAFKNKQ